MKVFLTVSIPFLFFSCRESTIAEPVSTSEKTEQNHANLFALGVVDSLHSTLLNETRTLNIYLPDGYSPDSSYTYPVIYLLDGSAHEDFVHTVGIVQFHTEVTWMMQPCIVVGIANVDRKRDFTFPTNNAEDKKEFPTTGGSEKFIEFIEKELQPHIETKYKVNETKLIVGQSLGGLLASEILLKKPHLFSHYIIVSPSTWWNDESLLHDADSLLAQQEQHDRRVHILVGNEEDQMEAGAKQISELLHKHWGENANVQFTYMPEEDHLTILHNALYKALPLWLEANY